MKEVTKEEIIWNAAVEAQRQELWRLFNKAGGTLSGLYTQIELDRPSFNKELCEAAKKLNQEP